MTFNISVDMQLHHHLHQVDKKGRKVYSPQVKEQALKPKINRQRLGKLFLFIWIYVVCFYLHLLQLYMLQIKSVISHFPSPHSLSSFDHHPVSFVLLLVVKITSSSQNVCTVQLRLPSLLCHNSSFSPHLNNVVYF